MRTTDTTPAWSDGHSGGSSWNGSSPITSALWARTAAWVKTRSIRELSSDALLVRVSFWQQVNPSPSAVSQASRKYDFVRIS
jgi:hypothetical protein